MILGFARQFEVTRLLQREWQVVVGSQEGGDSASGCSVALHGLGDASVAFVSRGWVGLRPVRLVWPVAVFLGFSSSVMLFFSFNYV